jgi:hypothetical protein
MPTGGTAKQTDRQQAGCVFEKASVDRLRETVKPNTISRSKEPSLMAGNKVTSCARPRAVGLSIRLLVLAALILLVLSPAMKTGYVSDDLTNSLTPGMLKVDGHSLVGYLWEVNWGLALQGRFFPLQLAEIATVFCLIPNLSLYKVFVILTVVTNVLLFFALVRQVSRNAEFALFTSVLMLGLFQMRAYYDPILSFAGVQQFIFATFVASLMTLQHYLEIMRRRWLVASALAYLVVLLTYEATYPFFLIHFLMICHGRRGWKQRLATTLPFAGLAGACVLTTVVLRVLYMPENHLYRVSTNVPAFFTTLLWQTSAALPLSYFLTDPASLFPAPWRLGALARFVRSASGLLIFAGVLTGAYLSLRRGPAGGGQPLAHRTRLLLLLGLGFLVLPALLVSTSVRYQNEIAPGKGYIPVYIESYGVALLLSAAVWPALVQRSGGSLRLPRAQLLISCVAAVVAALTFQANVRVAEAITKPPGSPGFNPGAGAVLGCYHRQRLNLEAASHAGLLDEVPDRSIVYLANEYHWWYERHHAPSFFAMHASKRLRTIPLNDTFYPDAPPTRESLLAMPGPTQPFLVRDVALNETAGYVVLSLYPASGGERRSSRDESDGSGRGLRLFVRHPKLFADGPIPAVVLVGNRWTSAAQAAGTESAQRFVRRARELTILKRGPDWAVVSLGAEASRIDPDSLSVLFGPVAADWGGGFYPSETGRQGWWRWCSQSGVLTLHNTTESPRTVRISMLLQANRGAPLVLDGDLFHAEVDPRSAPVRFERELTLVPGSHPILISTEAPPYKIPPEIPRTLRFRMINFTLQDKGCSKAEGRPRVARLAK